jgi:hypothetical protein
VSCVAVEEVHISAASVRVNGSATRRVVVLAPDCMLPDHRNVLSWGEVVAWSPVVVGLDVRASCQFIDAGEAVASAHGRAV